MIRKISLGLILFAMWLLLSGHYAPREVAMGVLSAILVVWIAHRMDVVDHEGHPIHLGWRAVAYFPWLFWEIFKANVDVARIILRKDMPISPVMLRVKAKQQGELGHVIFANSITLTPGTFTVSIDGDDIDVHAITREAAAELDNGRMNERVAQMEGEEDKLEAAG